MGGRGGGGRRVLLPPIQYIFKLLQQRVVVKVWLYEQLGIHVEGKISVGVAYRGNEPRDQGWRGQDWRNQS
jgi:hypothetical protein